MIRAKAMAVLLGPAGFGLMGVYDSIINLAQSIAGLGINSSGVRQIAKQSVRAKQVGLREPLLFCEEHRSFSGY